MTLPWTRWRTMICLGQSVPETHIEKGTCPRPRWVRIHLKNSRTLFHLIFVPGFIDVFTHLFAGLILSQFLSKPKSEEMWDLGLMPIWVSVALAFLEFISSYFGDGFFLSSGDTIPFSSVEANTLPHRVGLWPWLGQLKFMFLWLQWVAQGMYATRAGTIRDLARTFTWELLREQSCILILILSCTAINLELTVTVNTFAAARRDPIWEWS